MSWKHPIAVVAVPRSSREINRLVKSLGAAVLDHGPWKSPQSSPYEHRQEGKAASARARLSPGADYFDCLASGSGGSCGGSVRC